MTCPCNSALALFLLHVAALEIAVPDSGVAGDFVSVDFIISQGDPTNVDLLLFDTNSNTNYTVSDDMKVTPQNVVIIPIDVHPGTCVHTFMIVQRMYSLTWRVTRYQFAATKVGYVLLSLSMTSDRVSADNTLFPPATTMRNMRVATISL